MRYYFFFFFYLYYSDYIARLQCLFKGMDTN